MDLSKEGLKTLYFFFLFFFYSDPRSRRWGHGEPDFDAEGKQFHDLDPEGEAELDPAHRTGVLAPPAEEVADLLVHKVDGYLAPRTNVDSEEVAHFPEPLRQDPSDTVSHQRVLLHVPDPETSPEPTSLLSLTGGRVDRPRAPGPHFMGSEVVEAEHFRNPHEAETHKEIRII